jgi:hypothetical protein
VGLLNEGSGEVDATENWWGSKLGPTEASFPAGIGDAIINSGGGSTAFIEFLCKPFPDGFPSQTGLCGIETIQLDQLALGRGPDINITSRFVVFQSTADLNNDSRIAASNTDGSSEVFLIDKRRPWIAHGTCLGGSQPGAVCRSSQDCPGIPNSDPVVLQGTCAVFSQLTDGSPPGASVDQLRISDTAHYLAFGWPALGTARQVLLWDRKRFEHGLSDVLTQTTDGIRLGQDSGHAELSGRGKWLVVESAADLTGFNADGNTEIFFLDIKSGIWTQVTDTRAPVENRRPLVNAQRTIVFDSNGDLNTNPKSTLRNADGNREIFEARLAPTGGSVITQLTDSEAPTENRSGASARAGQEVIFTSTGDLNDDPLTLASNRDGNWEIFVWNARHRRITQLTDSIGGENVMPALSPGGRWVVFESTADLESDGSRNRRIFQLDLLHGRPPLKLSRSRFGDNYNPRTNGQFAVWESTADLTGYNPLHDSVIYLLDRRLDENTFP